MTHWLDEEIAELRRLGLYRTRRRLASGQGAEVRLRSADCVNFSSNDYLGYASDPRLTRVATRAIARYGVGSGASPLVSGYLPPLASLERDLAAWEGVESALVYSCGYQGHLGVITALAGKGDAIFSDSGNHASLIDGCRLSRASVFVFPHRDLQQLRRLLTEQASKARRRLIVSDSVFSMDGDLADVGGLLNLAREFDAMLVLDEAHATGVLGQHGRGLTDTLPEGDARDERLIKLGTLSKAMGSQGGFVCGSARVVEYLVNKSRSYIFSTALAPGLAAAARQSIFLIGQEPQRRQHVLHLGELLRQRLRELGISVGDSVCHIVSVILGEPDRAVALSRWLEEEHMILAPAIRPPSVPSGTSRLRISLTAGHTEEDITRLVAALRQG